MHQAKKLLHGQGNAHESEKAAKEMGTYTSDKGLISRICKMLKKLSNNKARNPAKKWTQM